MAKINDQNKRSILSELYSTVVDQAQTTVKAVAEQAAEQIESVSLREMTPEQWKAFKKNSDGTQGPETIRQFRRDSARFLRRVAHGLSSEEKSNLHAKVDAYHRQLENFLVDPQQLIHWKQNHEAMRQLLQEGADALAHLPKKEYGYLQIEHNLLEARLLQGEGKFGEAFALLQKTEQFLDNIDPKSLPSAWPDKQEWCHQVRKQLKFEQACVLLWQHWKDPASELKLSLARSYFSQAVATNQESTYFNKLFECVKKNKALIDMSSFRHGVTTSRFIYSPAPQADYKEIAIEEFKVEYTQQKSTYNLYALKKLAKQRALQMGAEPLNAKQRQELGEFLFEYHLAQYLEQHPEDYGREQEFRAWWQDQITYLQAEIAGLSGYEAIQKVQDYFSVIFMKYDPDNKSAADFYFSKSGANCVANSAFILAAVLQLGIEPDQGIKLAVQNYEDHAAAVLFQKEDGVPQHMDLVGGGGWSTEIKSPIYSLNAIYYDIAKVDLAKKLPISQRKALLEKMRLAAINTKSQDGGVIPRDRTTVTDATYGEQSLIARVLDMSFQASTLQGYFQEAPPLEAGKNMIRALGVAGSGDESGYVEGQDDFDVKPVTKELNGFSYERKSYNDEYYWCIQHREKRLDNLDSILTSLLSTPHSNSSQVLSLLTKIASDTVQLNRVSPRWLKSKNFLTNPMQAISDEESLYTNRVLDASFEHLHRIFGEAKQRLYNDPNSTGKLLQLQDAIQTHLTPELKAMLESAKTLSDHIQNNPSAFLNFFRMKNRSQMVSWLRVVEKLMSYYNSILAIPGNEIRFTTPGGQQCASVSEYALGLMNEVSIVRYMDVQLVGEVGEQSAKLPPASTAKGGAEVARPVQANHQWNYSLSEKEWLIMTVNFLFCREGLEEEKLDTFLSPSLFAKLERCFKGQEEEFKKDKYVYGYGPVVLLMLIILNIYQRHDLKAELAAWGPETPYVEFETQGSEGKTWLMPKAVFELYELASKIKGANFYKVKSVRKVPVPIVN